MKPLVLYEDHLFYWGVYLNMADNTKLNEMKSVRPLSANNEAVSC